MSAGASPIRSTRYFDEQVLRKRPYLDRAQVADVVSAPIRRILQPDGRIRFWGEVIDGRDGKTRYLRVVTLSDGETVHNAFFDRDFEASSP